ncbi:MAG: hypothetical protein ACRDBH_10690 [Bosea sp. (in: a-proteobacteria)]
MSNALATTDQSYGDLDTPASRSMAVHSDIAVLDTARFEHMWRVAKVMAMGSLMPETLRKDKNRDLSASEIAANCFMVVNQAVGWGMDPFAVAQGCSVVHGRLMHEGKLIAAVLDQVGKVRLRYEYSGDARSLQRKIEVIGRLPDEDFDRSVSGTVDDWKTNGSNSPWSAANYDRQLAYRGAREWARRHRPSVLLGVYSEDEFDEDVSQKQISTPSKPLAITADFPQQKLTPKAEKPKTQAAKATPQASKDDTKPANTEPKPPVELNLDKVKADLAAASDRVGVLSILDAAICAPDGSINQPNNIVADLWKVAATHPATALPEDQAAPDGFLECLFVAARKTDLNALDDFAMWCEDERWLKSDAPKRKATFRAHLLAFRDGLSQDDDA